MLQRTTAAIVVRVNGEPIGIAPSSCGTATRIEFGDCRLVFETDALGAADLAPDGASGRHGRDDGGRDAVLALTGEALRRALSLESASERGSRSAALVTCGRDTTSASRCGGSRSGATTRAT